MNNEQYTPPFALAKSLDRKERSKAATDSLVYELRKHRQQTGKTLHESLKDEHERRVSKVIKKAKNRNKQKKESISLNADNTITLTLDQLRALLQH